MRADRVLLGQRAFTPGFESIIVGRYLPLAAPQESFFASGCYAIKCSGLATGLEQVRHKLPWDVGEHHVRLLARLSFHQWFVDDMEISGDWGPIWLRSWLALASWPGTGVCVCVFFFSFVMRCVVGSAAQTRFAQLGVLKYGGLVLRIGLAIPLV